LLLDDYIVDILMRDLCGHDRHPSAFLVYLWLYGRSGGGAVQVALQDIAEGAGIAKRSVQSAIAHLVKRKLISIERAGITAVAVYTVNRPWRR
jgi:hypothetical protein